MNSAKWLLSKYARWEEGNWTLSQNVTNQALALIIQELQLIVLQGDVVLESLSLTQSKKYIKSVYKNGTLVIAVKYEGNNFKFRVLFSSLSDGRECVELLKNYIDVNCAEGLKSTEETLPEMLVKALKDEDNFPVPDTIPEEYPLEDAIKLCILDPGFPKLVGKVEKILKDLGKSQK